jgi:hypothetical protein
MFRLPSPRLAAALFVFTTSALAVSPAGAQGAPAAATATTTESAYAAIVRSINPKLPLAKARAYARSVMADAWRTHLDPRFIMSIVTVESAWRANAISRAGARGLGQLMPGTARRLGVNAWNAADNLRGTSTYLQALMSHFAGKPNAVKLAIAGYNAGPKAVERYHGVPPYRETRNYVVRVLHVWRQLDARVGKAFAAQPATVAVRGAKLPDEQQWLSNVNEVLPATAAAVESIPNPALTAGPLAGAAESASAATTTSEPAK